MASRFGLILVGALASLAGVPGCLAEKQHTIIDQSWTARDHSGQVMKFEAAQPKPRPGDDEPMRFVSPLIDPPPQKLPILDPILTGKTVQGQPTVFEKPIVNDKDPMVLPGPIATTPREPLTLALQAILDNRHAEALDHLKKYDPATQELFIRLLPLMADMCKKSVDKLSTAEVNALREQLMGLENSIRPRTELAIDKMCFCQQITAYGVYKTLPDNHAFIAGTPNRPGELVQLYVELGNFGSEPREGWFETRLASTVEILDGQGKTIWSKPFHDNKKPYRSKTQIHDYYNNYRFYVPHLPAGNYTLKLQVADESRPEVRRVANKTLDFRVTTLPQP